MSGRERARRIMGLGQPEIPKQWDFPETIEELQRQTGAEWRPLPYSPQARWVYVPEEEDDPESFEGLWELPEDIDTLEHSLWEQAWATRYNGWLIIYHITQTIRYPAGGPQRLRAARMDTLSHPELDRASVERIVKEWWRFVEMPGEPLVVETDIPQTRYLIQFGVPHHDARAVGLPQLMDLFYLLPGRVAHPDVLAGELMLMRAIVDRIQETR